MLHATTDTIGHSIGQLQSVLPWLAADRTYRLYNLRKQTFVSAEAYQAIGVGGANTFIVCRDGKKGLVDSMGRSILPLAYTEVSPVWPGRFSVTKEGKTGVVDGEGRFLLPCEYTDVYTSANGWYYIITDSGGRSLFGLADPTGAIRIKPAYEKLSFLHGQYYEAGSKGRVGVVDQDGNVVIPFSFESVSNGLPGQYIVSVDDRLGVIRWDGKFLITPQYRYLSCTKPASDDIRGHSANCYIATTPDLTHLLVDSSAKVLLRTKGSISPLGSALFAVAAFAEGKSGTTSSSRQIYDAVRRGFLNSRKYTVVGECREGKILVAEGSRLGYIDTAGMPVSKTLISSSYQLLNPNHGDGQSHQIGEGLYKEIDGWDNRSCIGIATPLRVDLSESPYIHEPEHFHGGHASLRVGQDAAILAASGSITFLRNCIGMTPFIHGIAQAVFVERDRDGKAREVACLVDTLGIIVGKDMEIHQVHPTLNLMVVAHLKTPVDQPSYSVFDPSTRSLQALGDGFEFISLVDGYGIAQYKGAPVFLYDGKPLMDANASFPEHEARILFSDGNVLLYAGEIDQAISRYIEAIHLRPKYIAAMMMLADSYRKKSDTAAAKVWYDRAVAESPMDLQLLNERATFLFESQLYMAALADFKLLSDMQPEESNHWFRAAFIEALKGNLEAAIEGYSKSILISPDIGDAYSNRADLYMLQKRYSEALSDYSVAIRLSEYISKEDKSLYYEKRAECNFQVGRKSDACADLKKAAQLGSVNALQRVRSNCR